MADIPPPPPGSAPLPPPYTRPPAPPSYSDIPPGAQLPPGTPGYVPPGGPGFPYQQPAGVSIMSQFSGMAGWSVILGVLSVGVPIVTGLTTGGSVVYFYVVPIFGFIRGIQAVTRGQVLGGIVGIALNVVGGIISLTVALVH